MTLPKHRTGDPHGPMGSAEAGVASPESAAIKPRPTDQLLGGPDPMIAGLVAPGQQ